MRRGRALAALTMAVALTGAACAGDGGGETEEGLLKVRFQQPIPESMAFFPYFVAQEFGYFEDEGLEVELTPSGETETTLQLAAGNIDIGAINPPEILASLTSGEDWVVFYDFYQENVFSIKAPGDSGISDMAGLEGKVLGITSEGGGELPLIEAALQEVGLTSGEDVELLAVGDGGPASAQALKDGTIDAYAAAIQDFVAIELEGVPLVDLTPTRFAELPANSLVVTREFFESEDGRTIVDGFARAWAKATYVGLNDPDLVYSIAQERVPEEAGDETFGRPFFETVLALIEPPGEDFGELNPDKWQLSEDLLIEVGELEEPIPPDSFLDDSAIAHANDWDESEVQQDMESFQA
jgi:NitT/TauT family transport system substrate-binding protein